MKHLGFGAAILCLASGTSLAAGGGEGCGGKRLDTVKTPLIEKADGLLARWSEVLAKPAQLSEADQAAMAKAKETLSQICPVCKQMPDTMAFLRQTLAVSNGLEKACEAYCQGEAAAAIPAEVKNSLKERAALLSRSQKLFVAAFGSESSGKACCKEGEKAESKKACCAEGAKKSCGADADCYVKLDKTADRLLSSWEGIPGQVEAFSADEKTRFQSAMTTIMKAEGEKCPLFHQTVLASRALLDRAVAIDAELEKACKEKAKDGEACAATTDEEKAMLKAFGDRTALLKKTVQLLDRMGKVMSPEPSNPLFTAQGQ